MARLQGRPAHQPYDFLHVSVDHIEGGFAYCLSATGTEHQVPMTRRVGRGGWPMVGDEWVLWKIASSWVFFCVIDGTDLTGPIEIQAPRDSMDLATEELFDALIRLGLVSEHGADYQR